MKLMKRKSWPTADHKIARLTGGVPRELPVAKDRVKGATPFWRSPKARRKAFEGLETA